MSNLRLAPAEITALADWWPRSGFATTAERNAAIVAAVLGGASDSEIAKRFRLCRSTVSNIWGAYRSEAGGRP